MNFIGVTGGPAFFVGVFGNEVSLSAANNKRKGIGNWTILTTQKPTGAWLSVNG
jgi:hypothetical protein